MKTRPKKVIPARATLFLQRVSCSSARCKACETKPSHGPYVYAQWTTKHRNGTKHHTAYVRKATEADKFELSNRPRGRPRKVRRHF